MKTLRLAAASVLAVAMLTVSVPAQEHPEHPTQSEKSAADTEAIEATLVGQNICLGCTLKKDKGAAAQCSKYGHRHVLKVTSATVDGTARPAMTGWVLHYLDTDAAQPAINEHHEETLTITGKVYSKERTLEVSDIAVAETPSESEKPEHPEHPK
ncbi:MAG: hypothetical protein Kow0074_14280 [Candidatus Zixiibacteriota bacterium]